MKSFTFCLISYILGLSIVGLMGSCEKDKHSHKPNIIIVLADDLGHGSIEALNSQSKIPTPNLNRLASEGIMFTDAHTSSAVCTPTRYDSHWTDTAGAQD